MTNVLLTHILRLAELPRRKTTEFLLAPEAPERQALADALGILGLKKLNFKGHLAPMNGADWQLSAKLGATVVQACVVTLAPVTTRIDINVERSYLAPTDTGRTDAGDDLGHEIPEDDTIEPLTPTIDLGLVIFEALTLNLPDYPRAPGAGLGEAVFAEPGIDPLTDGDLKPFAGLADLRNKLDKDKEG